VDATYHFPGLSTESSGVFELSFYALGHPERLPQDLRVGLTIIYLIEIFFVNYENVLLYICESLDRKHYARKRKFDSWFNRYGTSDFEKFDYALQVSTEEILVSAILSKRNTNRAELIRAFEEGYSFYMGLK
jgi:hypothetical protein